MSQTGARCPDCGAPSADPMLPGLCPSCLMGLAMTGAAAAAVGAAHSFGNSSDHGLLGAVEDAHGPLIAGGEEAPAAGAAAQRIGPYRIIRRIAEGGMGVVYEAEQERPITRKVALKVVRAGMDSEEVVARFISERQALALMSHANIAKVFDAGTTPDGRPFFAMEFVPGEPITAYCDRHRLSSRARLELFVQACAAVEHAHHKGIIHRDIKPSNVLVTDDQGKPLVKVIDFGIAKALSGRLTEQTLYTAHGRLLGTPAYMSPEQLERGSLDVDTRADVYGLGVLLYELLAGSLPVEVDTTATLSFGALRRALLAGEPPSPSARLAALAPEERDEVASARGTQWGELHRELRAELEWIPLKAIRGERSERYRSASLLADDVRNYLAGRALMAGPRTKAYLARKFVRNHRVGVGLASVAAAIILGLLVGLSIVTAREIRAQASAKAESERAQKSAADARLAQQTAERNLLGELVRSGDGVAMSSPAEARADYLTALDRAHSLQLDDATILARLFVVPAPEVPLMGAYRRREGVGGFANAEIGHPNCVALLENERVAVTCEGAPNLKFWDLLTGRLVTQWPAAEGDNKIGYVSVSPDGQTILTGGYDSTVRLWDAKTGVAKGTGKEQPDAKGEIYCAVFSSDGRMAASGDNNGNIYIWDLTHLTAIRHWPGHARAAASLAFSHDGKHLASGGHDGVVKVWDVASGQVLDPWQRAANLEAPVNSVVWSADESAVFSSSFDGAVRRWDCQDPDKPETLDRLKALSWRVARSPDGSRLVSGYRNGALRLLNANTGEVLHEFEGHAGEVLGLSFFHDGRAIVAGGEPSFLRVWSTEDAGRFLRAPVTAGSVTHGAVADDGLALLGTAAGHVLICDIAGGRVLRDVAAHGQPITGVQFVPGGTRAVSCARDGVVKLWDLATGRELKHAAAATGHPVLELAVTAQAGVVVRTPRGIVHWDFDGEPAGVIDEPGITCLAASGGTGMIVFGREDGQARCLDLAGGNTPPPTVPEGPRGPTKAAISPDGRAVALAAGGEFWGCFAPHGSASEAFGPFTGEVGEITALAFLPDARTVLVGGRDGAAELWDLIEGRVVARIPHDDAGIAALTLAPGARKALSIGADGVARLWDFTRAATQHAFESQLPQARAKLDKAPNDPAALAAFADWYAFRGRPDWAVELLSSAGKGAPVPHLTLARLHWQKGDAAAAAREYQLAGAAREVSPLMAQLWASAPLPATATTAPATTMPAAVSSTK